MFFSCDKELPNQHWQKGNLHTHSFWSDGDDFPEMILKWYKDNNYQFTALSDHNTIASGDYWYKLKKSDINNKTLEKYQIKISRYMCGNYINFFFDNDYTETSLKAHRLINGQNVNEVTLVPKDIENKGFFEKFFQLFS